MKKRMLSLMTAFAVMPVFSSYRVNAADYSLWDKFLKYDLCITNYNALSEEKKQLCHFIFDTEQSANGDIVCERARRILAGDTDLGERINLEQLENSDGIWDNYSPYKAGWQSYIHCVPDIIHFAPTESGEPYLYGNYMECEYWLDDTGSKYVKFYDNRNFDDEKYFEVFDSDDNVIQKIPAKKIDSPYYTSIRYNADAELMAENGFIEKNGGYYYINPDNTAVFACIDNSYKKGKEAITQPFVVESEINGCPVTAIEKNAFCESLFTEIVLPDSLEIIDNESFSECKYLETINFPKGLKVIGYNAFAGCFNMKELNIDCPECTVMRMAFIWDESLENVSINVKNIEDEAFSGCYGLKNIKLGDSVKKLSAGVFRNCIALESIDISLLKAIGQEAFCGSAVKSVTVSPATNIIGAVPMHKPAISLSVGFIENNHPLTDEPICAFDSDCVIYGYEGTEAESYADEWNLEFIPLEYTQGDVNFDEKFNISDIVTMQNWLLNKPDSELNYWKAADICEDNQLDVFDLCLMKEMLVE